MGCAASRSVGVQEPGTGTGTCSQSSKGNPLSTGRDLSSDAPATDSKSSTQSLSTRHGSLGLSPSGAAQPALVPPELTWKSDSSAEHANICTPITEIQRETCAALHYPVCLTGLFDTNNVWYSTVSGVFTPGLPKPGTFCELLAETIDPSSPKDSYCFIQNAAENPRFANHPSVLHKPHARAYLGVPMISTDGRHCLGTFAVVDVTPRDPPSAADLEKMRGFATRAVTALQADVMERAAGGSAHSGRSAEATELPAVWLDVSQPDWRVVGINHEFEELTGVGLPALLARHGLFSVMTPGDEAELSALREAVGSADRASNPSLPAIMTPCDASGEHLQFVFALRPATVAPPLPRRLPPPPAPETLWVAEVHARVQAVDRPTSTSTDEAKPSSGSDPRFSAGSGGLPTSSSERLSSTDPAQFGQFSTSSGEGRNSGGIIGTSGTVGTMGTLVSSSGDVSVPARLASLQLGALLGRGSFGRVYSGVLRGRPVAVKVVERVVGPESAQLLWEAQFEALVALQRAHENVVPTYDFIRDEATGSVWIVQELCSLGDVGAQFRQGALQDAQGRPHAHAVVETALEIARGMAYLHSQSVMHGDLSSNNVLLAAAENSRGFVAKVSDFGLARVSNRELSTQSLGTVSHMAPELLMEGRMTPASDVFSYGVLLWELWTGQRAWAGSSVGHVIFSVTVKKTRLALPESAPPALRELTDECTRTEREERPTFEEVVQRLEELLATLPSEGDDAGGSGEDAS